MKSFFSVKTLLVIFILTTIFLSFLLLSRRYVCENFISKKYEIIHPNPKSKCDYIILKKKTDKKGYTWLGSIDKINDKKNYASTIPIEKAAEFIQNYNEKWNSDLLKSSFIDMDRSEMLLYLIDVASAANWDKSNVCRIYLADRNPAITVGEISAIVTAKTDQGEIFIPNKELLPLDWGSLCPPPYNNCINEKKAELIKKAVWKSERLKFARQSVSKPETK